MAAGPVCPPDASRTKLGFGPEARVRARAEFDRVFRHGKRAAMPALTLHWLHDAAPARLGLAVSRKVDSRAVGRNRIKRILRDQFRQLRPQLVPGAYVVVARPPASTLPPGELRQVFLKLLQRARALPPSHADGTMPAASPIPNPAPPPAGQ